MRDGGIKREDVLLTGLRDAKTLLGALACPFEKLRRTRQRSEGSGRVLEVTLGASKH